MKKILFLLFIFISITGCEYFTLMSKKEWIEKTGNQDDVIIYAAGAWYDSSITNYRACYWIIKGDNIERIDLESNNIFSTVNSIYVDEDNIYTCGFDLVGAETKACYWINKKIKYLDDLNNGLSSMAFDISSKNGVVFTAGMLDGTAYYWINKNKITLNINIANTIFIHQISTSKYNLYLGGQNSKSPFQACYIKDGKINDLPPLPGGSDTSDVSSIFVIGNIVYSAGQLTLGLTDYACLWKNDDITILPDGTLARSVFVTSEDVYIAGEYDSGTNIYPRYWKNNKSFTLPDSDLGAGTDSFAYSIFVFNDNVYIGGLDDDAGNSLAWYWTDGKKIIFDPSLNAGVTSIFVKSNTEK